MPTSVPLLTERFARQGLAARSAGSVVAAAALTTAVQAQDYQASRFGVRARTPSATEADVVAATEANRTVVRTWLMRGTIHLVGTRDRRWLVRLIGPTIERRYRTRWRQLGLADDLLAPTADALPDGDPQIPTHTVVHAATAADSTTWSGVGAGRAVELLRDELTSSDVDGRPGFRLGAVEPRGGVRLLPAFDNHLLGYRDRAGPLPPESNGSCTAGASLADPGRRRRGRGHLVARPRQADGPGHGDAVRLTDQPGADGRRG